MNFFFTSIHFTFQSNGEEKYQVIEKLEKDVLPVVQEHYSGSNAPGESGRVDAAADAGEQDQGHKYTKKTRSKNFCDSGLVFSSVAD